MRSPTHLDQFAMQNSTDRLPLDTSAYDTQLALFLDVDGTLVEIADKPDAVHVRDDVPELLNDLFSLLDGAVALLSGRSIQNIDSLLPGARLPTAGIHGLEFRNANGHTESQEPPDSLHGVKQTLKALSEAHQGILLEDKGRSIAVHYRQAPSIGNLILDRVENAVAGARDLTCLRGKMVVEVKSAAANKGTALRKFMSAQPFAGRRPLVIGDDITDEAAFAAANELAGVSVCVGSRENTEANFVIRDVTSTLEWLSGLRAHLKARD